MYIVQWSVPVESNRTQWLNDPKTISHKMKSMLCPCYVIHPNIIKPAAGPKEKKGIFAQKQPNLAFLVNLGQAMQAYSVPCWWVGWWLWRAGCISQDTYLLYDLKEKGQR